MGHVTRGSGDQGDPVAGLQLQDLTVSSSAHIVPSCSADALTPAQLGQRRPYLGGITATEYASCTKSVHACSRQHAGSTHSSEERT